MCSPGNRYLTVFVDWYVAIRTLSSCVSFEASIESWLRMAALVDRKMQWFPPKDCDCFTYGYYCQFLYTLFSILSVNLLCLYPNKTFVLC